MRQRSGIKAPEKIEAYERLASLLREGGGSDDPRTADKMMDEMVLSSPEDYHVYVAQGPIPAPVWRIGRQGRHRKGVSLAGEQPPVCLEMAREAEADHDQDQAQKSLMRVWKKYPTQCSFSRN